MKKYIVYAEEIKKLYIEVEAENKTDAYLKASKEQMANFKDTQRRGFYVLASNIHEAVV